MKRIHLLNLNGFLIELSLYGFIHKTKSIFKTQICIDISEGTSVIPEKQAGIEIFSCNDDYISVNSIRLCGEKLNDASRNEDLTMNAVITDSTNGLNIIPVRTSATSVGRGFRINYIQIPCDDQPITTDATNEFTEKAPADNAGPISKYKRNKRT